MDDVEAHYDFPERGLCQDSLHVRLADFGLPEMGRNWMKAGRRTFIRFSGALSSPISLLVMCDSFARINSVEAKLSKLPNV
jgi:hypothetical protein